MSNTNDMDHLQHKENIAQIRDMASNLLRSGMYINDVAKEVHNVAKTIIPQETSPLCHAELAAIYAREALEGLSGPLQRRYEMK